MIPLSLFEALVYVYIYQVLNNWCIALGYIVYGPESFSSYDSAYLSLFLFLCFLYRRYFAFLYLSFFAVRSRPRKEAFSRSSAIRTLNKLWPDGPVICLSPLPPTPHCRTYNTNTWCPVSIFPSFYRSAGVGIELLRSAAL